MHDSFFTPLRKHGKVRRKESIPIPPPPQEMFKGQNEFWRSGQAKMNIVRGHTVHRKAVPVHAIGAGVANAFLAPWNVLDFVIVLRGSGPLVRVGKGSIAGPNMPQPREPKGNGKKVCRGQGIVRRGSGRRGYGKGELCRIGSKGQSENRSPGNQAVKRGEHWALERSLVGLWPSSMIGSMSITCGLGAAIECMAGWSPNSLHRSTSLYFIQICENLFF